MRKILVGIFCLVLFQVGFGAEVVEKMMLWGAGKMPDAQPHQIAAMRSDTQKAGFQAEEHREPYLEWLTPPSQDVRQDVCMLLISGGSYQTACDEAYVYHAWPDKLTAEGVQCVNLVYRTPRPKGIPIYQTAWEDGQRAVRLLRREAAKRGYDPEKIGVMGMSAGSHLATLLATSSQTPAYEPTDEVDKIPCHINWSCNFATAYALTDGIGCPNTRQGDAVDVTLDSCFKFDEKTCPMWLSHGGADPFSPFASTRIYRRLREMKIPAEVHLYPSKPHGMFGLDRALEFMHQMGYLGPVAPEEKLLGRFTSDEARVSHEKRPVWDEGKMPNRQAHQDVPFLEWHMPKVLKTKAIQIIYAGGAYWGNDQDGFEVTPARRYLNEKGMTVVTMHYRVPRPKGLAKHTTAWQDLQRTIRLVRKGAQERGLDPNRIGIMGSSAGGHLTLMGATSSLRRSYLPIDDLDKFSCSVAWGIGIYPAYSLTDGIDNQNTHKGNRDEDRLVMDFAFDLKTPPMLFIHGDADEYSSMASVKVWEQMNRMGIQSEVHTLATRHHCFQRTASPQTGSFTWLDRIWEFLEAKGFVQD